MIHLFKNFIRTSFGRARVPDSGDSNLKEANRTGIRTGKEGWWKKEDVFPSK
jgi:hypothetical protein